MAIWPFRRKRRAATIGGNETSAHATARQLSVADKNIPTPAPAATAPPPDAHTPSVHITIGNDTRRVRERKRPASQQDQASPGAAGQISKRPNTAGQASKENVPPSRHGRNTSREDITALPSQLKLEQSPHLRPVDLGRPQAPIPYNFRPHSMSQTSVQRQEATAVRLPRPRTLQAKRSTNDYGSPARILSRNSSKASRRHDDRLREEEIRAMSAPIPIPKRRGDDQMKRDSKKFRGSLVDLPPEGSIHSAMSGVVEQRGWEVGGFAVFSPRPGVRLSGAPQYVPSSVPNSASGYLYRIDSMPREKDRDKGKEKASTINRDRDRKRRTVGNEADDLDASDIRAIMERDAKRRELRQKERQDKLERKLRSREGRNRGDSDVRRARRSEAEEESRAEADRSFVQEQAQARRILTPPTGVHPALRKMATGDEPESAPVGLGIGKQPPPVVPMESERPQQHPIPTTEDLGTENTGTYLNYRGAGDVPRDPFSDEAKSGTPPYATPVEEFPPPVLGASIPSSPTDEIHEEKPVLGTAQAVRMSQANTPPLSPVYGVRATSNASQLTDAIRQQSASKLSTSVESSDLPSPPRINVDRRNSDQPIDKVNRWGGLFKRGFSRRRKPPPLAPSETGFSNTSRDSMRTQPIPAHLIDPDARRPPTLHSGSGTPVRTQSKFREDLPDSPISPPDSRTQSPDVSTAAGAVAAARRAGRVTPQPVDIPGRDRAVDRNDTPLSQSMRGHAAMSGSLASIDSEGSWLASGGSLKRKSAQSALSRNLSQRPPEFSASYEELGTGDKDAEYMSRNRASRKISSPALMGASPDEESEDEAAAETAGEPMTVHGSVRRKPTLVQRDPRLKSREGLVTEFASADQVETPAESTGDTPTDEEVEPDSPGPQMERARSVNLGSRHSRHFSAGSAKLLMVPSKRTSMDLARKTPSPGPTSAPRVESSEVIPPKDQ